MAKNDKIPFERFTRNIYYASVPGSPGVTVFVHPAGSPWLGDSYGFTIWDSDGVIGSGADPSWTQSDAVSAAEWVLEKTSGESTRTAIEDVLRLVRDESAKAKAKEVGS